MNGIKFFATTGTQAIADRVFDELQERVCLEDPHHRVEAGCMKVDTFSNQNMEVQVDDVRDRTVIVLHTQAPPVSDNLIEMFALLSAITKAQAEKIILCFPYMPYSRSDRKDKPRISVMGEDLPRIINEIYGVKHVLLIDPHAPQLKHYFRPTADEIPAVPLLLLHLRNKIISKQNRDDWVLAFADAGATKRFEHAPQILGIQPVHIHKVRRDNTEKPKVQGIIGDVAGKCCVLIDDEILTGATVIQDATALKKNGAKYVVMVSPHAVFMSKSKSDAELMKSLADSPVDQFIVSDTIPVRHKIDGLEEKFTLVSSGGLIGEAIKRMIFGQSLSAFHSVENLKPFGNV